MHFKIIPTERCYRCKRQNQRVYNRREVQKGFGRRRVCLCDGCHALEMNTPTPTKIETLHIHGTQLRGTNENLQRLLHALGG